MNNTSPPRSARALEADVPLKAIVTGLVLGTLVGLMAVRHRGQMFSFTMALVLLVFGTLAFVLYALDIAATRANISADAIAGANAGAEGEAARDDPPIHHWLGAIACGVLIALQAVDLIAG